MEKEYWYYVSHGKMTGPFSIEHIKKLYKENHINNHTLVWKLNMYSWLELKDTKLYTYIK